VAAAGLALVVVGGCLACLGAVTVPADGGAPLGGRPGRPVSVACRGAGCPRA